MTLWLIVDPNSGNVCHIFCDEEKANLFMESKSITEYSIERHETDDEPNDA